MPTYKASWAPIECHFKKGGPWVLKSLGTPGLDHCATNQERRTGERTFFARQIKKAQLADCHNLNNEIGKVLVSLTRLGLRKVSKLC